VIDPGHAIQFTSAANAFAALTALASTSALVIGLASLLRDANTFPVAKMAPAASVAAPVVAKAPVMAPATVDIPMPAPQPAVAHNATEAREWIDNWKAKIQSAKDQAFSAEAAPAVGAPGDAVVIANGGVESARIWIANWKARTQKAAAPATMETTGYQAAVGRALADSATPLEGMRCRVVTITHDYQKKIDNLWKSFAEMKIKEQKLIAKVEAITLDLEEVDAARKEERVAAATTSTSPLARALAYVQALWTATLAFFFTVFRGVSNGGRAATA
jgi:hypothetical protein